MSTKTDTYRITITATVDAVIYVAATSEDEARVKAEHVLYASESDQTSEQISDYNHVIGELREDVFNTELKIKNVGKM